MKYILYTDGGCRDTYGGWAWVLTKDGKTAIASDSGSELNTTNNKMELTAILNGLQQLCVGDEVKLYSDSQYALNICFGTWKATTNFELISAIKETSEGIYIIPNWVKGHADNKLNNMCDELCTKQIEQLKKKI